MKYSWLILTITVFFTFCTKRKKGDTFPEFVTLRITVKDNLGALRPGASVALFNIEADYIKAKQGDTVVVPTLFAIADTAGKVTLEGVEANIEQWLLVRQLDVTQNILYSNQNLSSTITKLLPGSVIEMEVIIEPLSANVAFYTSSTTNLPVYVRFDGRLDSVVTTVSSPTLITPTSNALALIVPVNAGVYPYQAYVKNGCTWTGSVTVGNGDFPKIGFDPCQLAKITFFFFDTIAAPVMDYGPYDVYVDDVKQGTLTSIYPNGPPSVCGDAVSGFTVTAYVESGVSHTYQVKANGSPCTWISNVGPIAAGGCQEVGISKTDVTGNSCP